MENGQKSCMWLKNPAPWKTNELKSCVWESELFSLHFCYENGSNTILLLSSPSLIAQVILPNPFSDPLLLKYTNTNIQIDQEGIIKRKIKTTTLQTHKCKCFTQLITKHRILLQYNIINLINCLLLFAVNMELTTLICLLLIAHDFN